MANPIHDLKSRVGDDKHAYVAASLGVSVTHLKDMIAGRRGIGPKALKALGIRIRYEYVDKAKREAFERSTGRKK
jgi:DNA-binding transcriptional regulator YdaS (Cro superfamily)